LADILSIYEETFNLALFPVITYYCSNYSPLDEVSEATYQILKYFLDIYPDSIKLFIRQLSICEHTFALLTVFQDLSAYEFTDTMLKKLYEGKPINALAYFTIMTQAANLTLADEFIHILLDSDEFLELQQLNPDNQSLRP
jgi:hypothetical protein